MKNITKLMLLLLLLSTTLFGNSNNHKMVTEYKLLNDVKFANKQKDYIENMGRILKLNIKDRENFNISKDLFGKVLTGLAIGDKSLKLKGTNLSVIRTKLNSIQKLWQKEEKNFDKAFSNNKSRLNAISTINKLSSEMKAIIAIYNKSYTRYKQYSKLSSIVTQHTITKQLIVMR